MGYLETAVLRLRRSGQGECCDTHDLQQSGHLRIVSSVASLPLPRLEVVDNVGGVTQLKVYRLLTQRVGILKAPESAAYFI